MGMLYDSFCLYRVFSIVLYGYSGEILGDDQLEIIYDYRRRFCDCALYWDVAALETRIQKTNSTACR